MNKYIVLVIIVWTCTATADPIEPQCHLYAQPPGREPISFGIGPYCDCAPRGMKHPIYYRALFYVVPAGLGSLPRCTPTSNQACRSGPVVVWTGSGSYRYETPWTIRCAHALEVD